MYGGLVLGRGNDFWRRRKGYENLRWRWEIRSIYGTF